MTLPICFSIVSIMAFISGYVLGRFFRYTIGHPKVYKEAFEEGITKGSMNNGQIAETCQTCYKDGYQDCLKT